VGHAQKVEKPDLHTNELGHRKDFSEAQWWIFPGGQDWL